MAPQSEQFCFIFLNIIGSFFLSKDCFYLIISLKLRALIVDKIGLPGFLLNRFKILAQSRNYFI